MRQKTAEKMTCEASGMPGGVMLQIGIHYSDVLEYLMGPIKAVRLPSNLAYSSAL